VGKRRKEHGYGLTAVGVGLAADWLRATCKQPTSSTERSFDGAATDACASSSERGKGSEIRLGELEYVTQTASTSRVASLRF